MDLKKNSILMKLLQRTPKCTLKLCLNYPWSLIDSVISSFDSRKSASIAEINADESNIVRINLPFQRSGFS